MFSQVELRWLSDDGLPTWLIGWIQLVAVVYLQGPAYGSLLFFTKNGVASLWYLTTAFANHNTEAAWRIEERLHAESWAEAQIYSCSDV